MGIQTYLLREGRVGLKVLLSPVVTEVVDSLSCLMCLGLHPPEIGASVLGMDWQYMSLCGMGRV